MFRYLLFLFAITGMGINSCPAQVRSMEDNHTLLWYRGSWKDRNTFLIDSDYITGKVALGTIFIKKNGNPEISTPVNLNFAHQLSQAILHLQSDEKHFDREIGQTGGINQYNLNLYTDRKIEKYISFFQKLLSGLPGQTTINRPALPKTGIRRTGPPGKPYSPRPVRHRSPVPSGGKRLSPPEQQQPVKGRRKRSPAPLDSARYPEEVGRTDFSTRSFPRALSGSGKKQPAPIDSARFRTTVHRTDLSTRTFPPVHSGKSGLQNQHSERVNQTRYPEGTARNHAVHSGYKAKITRAGTVKNPADSCSMLKPDYDAIMNYYALYKNSLDGHYDYPRPPAADYYRCWGCQFKNQQVFDASLKKYDTLFFRDENSLISQGMNILKFMASLGKNGKSRWVPGANLTDPLFYTDPQDSLKSGACAYLDYTRLAQAFHFLADRELLKARQLLRDTRMADPDLTSLEPAIRVNLLAVSRAMQLGLDTGESKLFSSLSAALEKLLGRIKNRLISEDDYSMIGDIPLMAGLASQIQLLRSSPDTTLNHLMTQLISFCHFRLSLEMNVKAGKDGVYVITHLKGYGDYIPELDSSHCITFVQDRRNTTGMDLYLLDNEMIAPKARWVYVGTRKYDTKPKIILHFCTPGKDIIYIPPIGAQSPGPGIMEYRVL